MLKLSRLEQKLLSWSKCLYFFSSFVLFIIGGAILAITIIAQLEMIGILTILKQYENFKLIVALVSSAILVLVTLMGMYGTIKLSFNVLVMNAILLLAIITHSVAFTAWAYVETDLSEDGPLYDQLYLEFRYYEEHKTSVDNLQSTLYCCGVDNFMDWNVTSTSFPSSCCDTTQESCSTDNSSLHKSGCFQILKLMLLYVGWTSIGGLLFVSILGILTFLLSLPVSQAVHYILKQEEEAKKLSLKIPRVTTLLPENNDENPIEESTENPEPPPAEEAKPEEVITTEELTETPKQESSEEPSRIKPSR